MLLKGSCHCQNVQFSLQSRTPVPFMECYCGICRKTAGGGGFAINLGGDAQSLTVQGREHVRIYHARMDRGAELYESTAERHFCGHCGSALWLWSKEWPELIHPFASAIDTPLPVAPSRVRIMLNYKPDWVMLPDAEAQHFGEYPKESLHEWHVRMGLLS